MNALHEHVGGDKHLRVGVVHHGAIVAHAPKRGLVLELYVVGEPVYEAELTELGDFHSWELKE